MRLGNLLVMVTNTWPVVTSPDETKHRRDEFSATSGRPSISRSSLRLTSSNFPNVIPATDKKSNPTRQCTLRSRKINSKGKPVRKETRYQCTEYQITRDSKLLLKLNAFTPVKN
ncbi:uncharacterized protein TNCV_3271891 [Trichonephila clavipes]|nr:uncharacterized protein TNCV_3271891 [Trichonephila clavipes]